MSDVEEPQPHRVRSVLLAVLGTMLLALFNTSGIALTIGAVVAFIEGTPDSAAVEKIVQRDLLSLTAGVLGASSAFLIVAVTLVAEPRDRIFARLRLNRTSPINFVIVTVGMLSLTTILMEIIEMLGVGTEGQLAELTKVFEDLDTVGRLRMLGVIALGPGITEELFFRGYGLTKLELAGDRTSAIVMTAALFGLIHFDPVHATAALIMGLFLGYAVASLNSLWPAICAHIINNALSAMFPGVGPEATSSRIALIAVCTVVLAIVVMLIRARREDHVVEW